MDVRYIQMTVCQDDYSKIKIAAFREDLTLSDFVEKATLFYLEYKIKEKENETNTSNPR